MRGCGALRSVPTPLGNDDISTRVTGIQSIQSLYITCLFGELDNVR
jgi:hypothetical protein